ncbi:GNAT family N-acetyltransferase [Polyangium mundeleinium]|uniref:N-acetyltransferase n=1 Tax=Polyangium mundeleinium TaxID=2995306 RepID=A0ABT5EGI5_9BACT|nr:N-acetyltransferase [Polyangium mundeleinium]MDC0740007.1 N-acetyltransferase [Polyangium mundeleinium]
MIRRADLTDLRAVFAVERDVFGTHVYPDFFFRQAFDLWGDTFFVADGENGSLDGYGIGASSHEPGVLWVLSLAVRGASRGRGLGKALMHALLAAMKARGTSSAKLTVHPDNPAVALYRNLGFEVIGEEPHYFGEKDPRLVMELRWG